MVLNLAVLQGMQVFMWAAPPLQCCAGMRYHKEHVPLQLLASFLSQ
jgi:hypothetical protein